MTLRLLRVMPRVTAHPTFSHLTGAQLAISAVMCGMYIWNVDKLAKNIP